MSAAAKPNFIHDRYLIFHSDDCSRSQARSSVAEGDSHE
jgi:hypothetical protein